MTMTELSPTNPPSMAVTVNGVVVPLEPAEPARVRIDRIVSVQDGWGWRAVRGHSVVDPGLAFPPVLGPSQTHVGLVMVLSAMTVITDGQITTLWPADDPDWIRGFQNVAIRVNDDARVDSGVRDWFFTFGSGHRGNAVSQFANRGNGFPLRNRYVVIRGTYDSARQRMVEIFGPVWCCQYGSPESAGVDEYGLTELVITDG